MSEAGGWPGLSAVAMAHLWRRGARFDQENRADSRTLRTALADFGIDCWPALEDIEARYGGLRFAESSDEWVLGPFAMTRLRRERTARVHLGTTLVCVGTKNDGRLFASARGTVWHEDASGGTVAEHASTMTKRIEKEAFGARARALEQRIEIDLHRLVDTPHLARLLDLPFQRPPSDAFETWWQGESLTLIRTTSGTRVSCRSRANLDRALHAIGRSSGMRSVEASTSDRGRCPDRVLGTRGNRALPVLSAEDGVKSLACPAQAHFGRRDAEIENDRDVMKTHLFDEAQNEDLPIRVRKP